MTSTISAQPKRFSEFAEEEGPLDGDKVRLDAVLNHEILVIDYRTSESKYKSKNRSGKCLTVQFSLPTSEERKVFFTGSDVLIDQIERYAEELPFFATIKKIDRYYTFT